MTDHLEATLIQRGSLRVRGGVVRMAKKGRALARDDVPVGSEPVVIGRDPACALVVRDARVSALHAELCASPLGLRVRDLGSRNGTYVNGVRIERAYLDDDATLTLGGTELTVSVEAPDRMALPSAATLHRLYGSTSVMRHVFERVLKAASTDLSVLIQGETGTGKELVAEAIHLSSARHAAPFVVVDCGAIPGTLAEAVLFGHERGAFTGASSRRVSPFVEARGGTVFLDELGELPLELQPKLLRVLAESRIKALGSSRYQDVDVRIVAATRRQLSHAINDESFRSDLFFRVAQVSIEVPPLRDRRADIPGLVRHMLRVSGREAQMKRIAADQLEVLMRHDWPGNVRELCNVVSAGVALAPARGPIDLLSYLRSSRARGAPGSAPEPFHAAKQRALERFEREYFTNLVASVGTNITEMGRQASLERAHVRKYLKRYGLVAERRKSSPSA
jgi:DNA-binding NtrC family response regulator